MERDHLSCILSMISDGQTGLFGQRHFESPIRHKILFRLTLRPSTFPSPPKSGEKVADRPDEGPAQDVNLRKKPPHPPALSPNLFATTLQRKTTHFPQTNRGRGGKVALSN